jgi:phosphate transport system substrate-binding protein
MMPSNSCERWEFKASPESVTKAAAGAVVPDDFRVSITNAPGAGAYPLSSFTWLLLYTDPPDKTQARALNEFVKWALTDGQQYAADLDFARLPDSLVSRELMALETIKTN